MFTETHLLKTVLFASMLNVCAVSLIHSLDMQLEEENAAYHIVPELPFLNSNMPPRCTILRESHKDIAHYEDCLAILIKRLASPTLKNAEEQEALQKTYASFRKHQSRLCLYQQLEALLMHQSKSWDSVTPIFICSDPLELHSTRSHALFTQLIIGDIVTVDDSKLRDKIIEEEFELFVKAGRNIRRTVSNGIEEQKS